MPKPLPHPTPDACQIDDDDVKPDDFFGCEVNESGHIEYKCKSCSKSYRHYASLNKHIRLVHKGLRNNFCNNCGKPF